MKKLLSLFTALFAMTGVAHAISFEQAQEQALFLADKMAYELNLTEEQYEACYEINLDYLMGITSQDDLYGDCWLQRNLDLSYIMLDWQYQLFLDAMYFYRPIYWLDGLWHFAVYSRYPHRNYFYFGRPKFIDTYRGGHGWKRNGGKSWYSAQKKPKKSSGKSNRGTASTTGMRDKFNKGDYGRGQNIDTKNKNNPIDNNGQSSTRLTVGNTSPSTGHANGVNAAPNGAEKNTPQGNDRTVSNATPKSTTTASPKNDGTTIKQSTTFNNTATKQTSTTPSRTTTTTTTKRSTASTPTTTTKKTTTSSSSAPKNTSSSATRSTGTSSSAKSSSATRSSSSATRSTGTSSSAKSSSTTRSSSSATRSTGTSSSAKSSSATRSSSSATRSTGTSSSAKSSSTTRSSSSATRSTSSGAKSSSSGARSSSGASRGGGGRK